jgi:sec-independent protein translocase protein TatC
VNADQGASGEEAGRASGGGASMPLTAHLEELRTRLIRSSLSVLAAFVACYLVADRLIVFMTAPLLRLEAEGLTVIGTGVAEAFFAKLKVAFVAAIFVAFPVLLWHAWRFVAPGLYRHERRYTKGFVFFGTLFFLLGAGFCYVVIFDIGYRFFLEQYQHLDIRPAIRVSEYLSFSAKLMLAFGVVFELPVVGVFLARVGLIDHRMMMRQFPYAFLGMVVLGAVLTPPDVISQVLLALPLTALYGLTIVLVYFIRRKG